MKLKKAADIITHYCAALDIEVAFSEDGIDIYWNNLRVHPSPDNLRDALLAISVLNNLGIQDN